MRGCYQMSWTRRFVIENLGFLLSKDNVVQTIKLKKKTFFHKKALKSSESFTLKDAAIETVKYLMDISRIKTEEDLKRYTNASSFLSAYLTEHQINALSGLIKPLKLGILDLSDLGKMGQEAYLKKKQEEFFAEAKKVAEKALKKERNDAMEEVQKEREHLEKLRGEVKQIMDEVRRMESLLDSLPSTFDPERYIVFSEEKKRIKPPQLWWRKIGLTGDPFPTKLGLYGLPEDKYDEVLVLTKMFQKYLGMIEDPKALFGKTIYIGGQFGSGKTTLLQYICYKIVPYKILPFTIILYPYGDLDRLRNQFNSNIYNSVSKAMVKRGLSDPRQDGVPIDKGSITEMLNYLSEKSEINGYVFMIDGLHKAESTIDTSLEFVKQLQNFHEYLYDNNVNVCIFVTGSPLWMRKITQNPAYSGSFYRIDEIPYINFDDAYKLLQKRFKSFANPDIPIFFDKGLVRFAYDCVYSDLGRGTTFRSFIDYVLPRLEKGNLKEVGISVSVDLEDVQRIDKELMASSITKPYCIFREATKEKVRLRKVCADVLKVTYRNRYLSEESRRFVNNKGAFFVLRNSHLIQKIKTRRGLGWTLSSEFLAVLEDLNEQGYPPEVVFQSFSVDPSIAMKRESKDDPVFGAAQDFLSKWESEWPEIVPSLNDFLKRHEKIVDSSILGKKKTLCKDCRNALLDLIQCAQILFKNSRSPSEWIEATWLDLTIKPTISSIIKQENVPEKDIVDYYQRYYHSATVLIERLEHLLEINRLINIISSLNRKKELASLFQAGNFLRNGDLDSAIEEANSSLEKRIRVAFHLAFSLHYGEEYLRFLPQQIQERILKLGKKGPVFLRRTVDKNLFYHFSRSEYAEVVNNKSIWSSFFEKIFYPRTREEIVQALRVNFALDDRSQHRDRIDYFRIQREKIRKAIINVDWLLHSLARVITLSLDPRSIFEESQNDIKTVRVSFVGKNQSDSSHPWKIDSTKENPISRRLTSFDRTLDFSDDMTISSQLGGAFAEVFIIMSILRKQKLINITIAPESSMHLKISPVPHS